MIGAFLRQNLKNSSKRLGRRPSSSKGWIAGGPEVNSCSFFSKSSSLWMLSDNILENPLARSRQYSAEWSPSNSVIEHSLVGNELHEPGPSSPGNTSERGGDSSLTPHPSSGLYEDSYSCSLRIWPCSFSASNLCIFKVSSCSLRRLIALACLSS